VPIEGVRVAVDLSSRARTCYPERGLVIPSVARDLPFVGLARKIPRCARDDRTWRDNRIWRDDSIWRDDRS